MTIQSEEFLTIVDAFSKFGQAYHLRDGTAVSVLQGLLNFCTNHGVPITIVTDNGTEFTNQLMAEFVKFHKIHHHRVAPHTPNENGIVERFHSTILEHLRILKLSQKSDSVINIMPYAILAYNSSIHSFTKCKPLDLVTGHVDPRDPFNIDISAHLLQQYMIDHKAKMTIVYNTVHEIGINERTNIMAGHNKDREPEVTYSPDQPVFIKNPVASRQKLAPRYTRDEVTANLPIHIYTKRKQGLISKSRLKRVPKSAQLLQETPGTSSLPHTSPNARDKT